MSAEYTIVVMDRSFKLSRSQIEFDSPNFFTSYFNAPGQITPRKLELSRDPYLFLIILRYLNGYRLLPLHPTLVPPYCTLDSTLADLRADAQFYQLSGLSALLASQNLEEDQLVFRYIEVAGSFATDPSSELEPSEDFDKVITGFSLKRSTEQQYRTVSKDKNFLTVPEKMDDGVRARFYTGLLNERIVRGVLQRDGLIAHVNHWELLGWTKSYPDEYSRQVSILVKIWAKPGLIINGSNDI
ncbi:unnamed protein product [Rhizoctonia solani]|uniref:BTB domain-containing protein n=1 Tax=Rhizoctonia solani TaxID=456999 RepID=A0A8H2XAN0_9AGAM|nr:unnamed protein product [Rhizoctonia solani]